MDGYNNNFYRSHACSFGWHGNGTRNDNQGDNQGQTRIETDKATCKCIPTLHRTGGFN